MIRVLLADDEPDARHLLRQYLSELPEYRLVAEATNGPEAVALVRQHRPDLIFLDVQMPGLNGFKVLAQLEELPAVIFSTAYDQYALEAFAVHALDYLLKPYGRKRFRAAVGRYAAQQEHVLRLAQTLLKQQQQYPERLFFERGARRLQVKTTTILRLEAFGDYCRVYDSDAAYLSKYGISELLDQLDPTVFWRVHRSAAVNIDRVIRLDRDGRYHVAVLTNGDRVRISERYLAEIKRRFM